MGVLRTISVVLILTSVLLSCQSQEFKSIWQSKTVTVEDLRIISLSGFLTEMLCEMGHLDKIVGRDQTSTHPESIMKVPNLGDIAKVETKDILSLNPNYLFIEEAQSNQTLAIEKLKQTDVEILIVPTSMTFDNSIKIAHIIKEKLGGTEEQYQRIKKTMLTDSIALDSLVKSSEKKLKILFIYPQESGRLLVSGLRTDVNTILEKIGGINAIQSYEGFKELDTETLKKIKPELILISSERLKMLGGKESLGKLAGISETPAYKNNKIMTIEEHFLTSFGPGTAKAVLDLAYKIH